jgi:hypothetical protein
VFDWHLFRRINNLTPRQDCTFFVGPALAAFITSKYAAPPEALGISKGTD